MKEKIYIVRSRRDFASAQGKVLRKIHPYTFPIFLLLENKKNSGRYAQEMLSALSPFRQLQLNFPTNNLSVHVFNCRSSRKCHLLVEFPRADFLFLRAQILFLTETDLCNFNSVCQREWFYFLKLSICFTCSIIGVNKIALNIDVYVVGISCQFTHL